MILCGKDDGDSSHSSEPAALDKWLRSAPSLELPFTKLNFRSYHSQVNLIF